MGTQIAIAEKIVKSEADYILAVKGNREGLRDEIESVGSGIVPFRTQRKRIRNTDG